MDAIKKEEYNNIPVYYCKGCLSLKVMGVAGLEDTCYCDECGDTNIEQASIEKWQELYKSKYGFYYIEK